MNKKLLIFSFCLVISNFSKAEILTVEVTSEYKDGPVLLLLYTIKKSILEKLKLIKRLIQNIYLLGAKGLISNYKGKVTFDLPYGKYVVAGIHDLDNNGVLNWKFFGNAKRAFWFF